MSTDHRNGRGPFVHRSNASNATQRRPQHGINAKASYLGYVALARAAALTGNVIDTENYFQHAEHYFRLMKSERNGSGLEDSDSRQDSSVSKAAINRGE